MTSPEPPAPTGYFWQCPNCRKSNAAGMQTCRSCGTLNPSSAPRAAAPQQAAPQQAAPLRQPPPSLDPPGGDEASTGPPPVEDGDTRVRRWTAIIGPLVGIGIFLFFAADYWMPLAAPFLPDQRVERASDGFAISLPPDWETVDAVEADPGDWWDEEKVDDVDELHEEQIADRGLVQLARTRSPLVSFEYCRLYDATGFAATAPAWTALEDAEADLTRVNPDIITSEAFYFELPAGRTLAVDMRWQDGDQQRDYFYLDGETWFDLQCLAQGAPPEDRWLSIAVTFEFLPAKRE